MDSKYVKGNILSLFKEQKLREINNLCENLSFLPSLMEHKLVQPLGKSEFSKYKLCYSLIPLLFLKFALLGDLSMTQGGIYKKFLTAYRLGKLKF